MITMIICFGLAILYFIVALGHDEDKIKWTAFVLALLMFIAGLQLQKERDIKLSAVQSLRACDMTEIQVLTNEVRLNVQEGETAK